MKRFRNLALAALVAVVAITTAYATPTQESTSSATDVETLRAALPGSPPTLDPSINWLHIVSHQQFLTLVDWDYDASDALPMAAADWSISSDGRTYTFNLRDGLVWSDGTPVTAGDFVYSFQTMVDPDVAAPIAYRAFIIENAQAVNQGNAPVSELAVTALDDSTVEITLTEPAGWFLSSLSSMGHSIPRHVKDAHGDAWYEPENVVANGPYKLVELVQEDRYVLEKNDSFYAADSVDIERIEFFVVGDASTQLAMFEANELDFIEDLPPGELDRIRNDSELGDLYYNGPRFIVYYYFFNLTDEPFDDPLVRKAFAASVDKQTITDRITRGGQVPAGTMTPPGSAGHVPNSVGVGIPYDPAQARALLAEAGYPNGQGLPVVELGYNSSQLNANVAQAIQQMWQNELNADVTLRGVEGGSYSQNAFQGAHNVWRMGWGMDYPDAHNIHMELFHSSIGQPVTFKSSEYDELIEEAAVETDPARRLELYTEAERILVEEEAGVIPIYWYAENVLVQENVDWPQSPRFMRQFANWNID